MSIQWKPGLAIFGIAIFAVERSTFVCPALVLVKPGYYGIPGLTMGVSLTEHKIFPVISGLSVFHELNAAALLSSFFR